MSEIWHIPLMFLMRGGKAHGSINVPVARSEQVGRCECGDELAVLAGLIKE